MLKNEIYFVLNGNDKIEFTVWVKKLHEQPPLWARVRSLRSFLFIYECISYTFEGSSWSGLWNSLIPDINLT